MSEDDFLIAATDSALAKLTAAISRSIERKLSMALDILCSSKMAQYSTFHRTPGEAWEEAGMLMNLAAEEERRRIGEAMAKMVALSDRLERATSSGAAKEQSTQSSSDDVLEGDAD